jgi:hypothetical protein
MLHEALTGTLPRGGRLSARLEEAPEHLGRLCSALLAERPELRPTPDELLRTLREHASPPIPRRVSELVGRTRELDELHGLLGRCREEGSRCVLVTGGPGVGKSAIVRTFLDRVDDGVVCVFGACHPRESIPYKGVDTIVHDLAMYASALDGPVQRSLLADGIAEAARIFPSLEKVEGLKGRVVASSDPQVFKRRASAALRAFVRSLARERPLIVCLDDAHWADADAQAVWLEVFGEPSKAPVLAILTARADDARGDEWRRALRAKGAPLHELAMSPLEPAAAQQLARELSAEPERALWIAGAAGGNPLLIEELARTPSAAGGTEPDPLGRLVQARADGLTDEARQVVILAALAGRPVNQATIFDAAEATGSTHRILSELHRAALVRTRSAPLPRLIELRHDRLRAALLGRFDEPLLRSAHDRLARSFEAHGEPPADTAEHYEKAGRPEAAHAHYVTAADQARRSFAFEAASRYFKAAIAMGVGDVERRADLELARAECLFDAGRCAEAAPAFLTSADLGAGRDARRRLRAAEAWLVAGRIDDGLGVAARIPGLTPIRTPGGGRVAASLAVKLARLLLRGTRLRKRTDPDGARWSFRSDASWTLAKGLMYVMPLQATASLVDALESALRAGDEFRVARSLGLLGAGMFMQIPGLASIGRSYLDQAAAIAARLDQQYLVAMDDVWRGFADMYEGRWSSMLERSDRGRTLLERRCVGTAWERVVAQGISAWALQFMGKLRESGQCAADGLGAAVSRGDLYGEVLFSQYLAYAEMAAGEVRGARARIVEGASKWTLRDYTVPRFYATVLQVMCDLLEARPRDARERLDADRADFRRSGGHLAPMSRIDEGLFRARVLLHEPAAGGARELDELARRMDRERRSDCPGHASFIRAARATQDGRTADARRGWSEAAERYARAEMILHAATARLRAGELARDSAMTDEARDTMRRCGVGQPEVWARAFMPAGAG